jgi:flagellar hook-length control protein FliK
MSEKQAFHVGEYSNEAMDVKAFQKMLGERGLNLRDLSMTQLAQLTQRTNRAQVTAFLDNLVSKMRDPKPAVSQGQNVRMSDEPRKDEQTRKTAEARAGETRPTEQPAARDPQLNLVAASERPQTTESQSRNEEREKVIRQIIEHMEIQTVGRKTELTMKLNPEYLGDMRVKLSTENGRLEASFETTSREVREFLEEGWEGLRDTFTRKGLNLQKVSATLVESLA